LTPEQEVIAEPVVDKLVGVLVGNDQAQFVELETDAEVVVITSVI
jgi:hypothetical protein